MNRRLTTCGLVALCLSATSAQAFFEEGNDEVGHPGYSRCLEQGNLTNAGMTGCNPWDDNDSSFTYQRLRDMKKNSVHYNATQALAAAAGFDRCAAFIIGLTDEATDVATAADQDLWLPFPQEVNPSDPACAAWLEDSGVSVRNNIVGIAGGFYSPDFSYRSFGTPQSNEINRESATFHWNHTDIDGTAVHGCSVVADPAPVITPDGTLLDFLSLHELRVWANSSGDPLRWNDPLNNCSYPSAPALGPIVAYEPGVEPDPGSLSALGAFLHSAQDSFSHKECLTNNHDFGPGTDAACGFVSSHFAGEFGAIDGKPASGTILVKTPASTLPYRVGLHSINTAEALKQTYWLLVEYLDNHPEYRAAAGCDQQGFDLQGFADAFSIIPNRMGQPSGAKRRSDVADSLFSSNSCQYTTPR